MLWNRLCGYVIGVSVEVANKAGQLSFDKGAPRRALIEFINPKVRIDAHINLWARSSDT